MSAGLNAGILLLSQLARLWPVTRRIGDGSFNWREHLPFGDLGSDCVARVASMARIERLNQQEKQQYLQSLSSRFDSMHPGRNLAQRNPHGRAWAASKWMIPWAEKMAVGDASYKAATQGWWALGATLGSFRWSAVGQLARPSDQLLCNQHRLHVVDYRMFQWTAPLQPAFHMIVFFKASWPRFFLAGWQSICLSYFRPTCERRGAELAFNSGRFATAAGVLFSGIPLQTLSEVTIRR